MKNTTTDIEFSDSRHCSAAFRTARTWAAALFLFGMSSYGACRLCDDLGITVRYADGSAHFWFEMDLRRWIHEK